MIMNLKMMKKNMTIKPILLMMKGLPGSGKSHYAKRLVSGEEVFAPEENEKRIWKRVNKDDLRAMIHDGKHTKSNEKDIVAARDTLITVCLGAGFSVVVDDTNFAPYHEKRLRELAHNLGADFYQKLMETTLDECIKNDLKRDASVGRDVILKMHEQYIRPTMHVEQDHSLPHAVIFDMDGTLSLMGDRNPYDASTCENDAPNEQVVYMCKMLYSCGKHIVIVSGRSEEYKSQTVSWLEKNGISCSALFMRPKDNWEKDWIIKKRIFMESIRPKWFIESAFDDRMQVSELCWRDLGITTFQVATGNF